MPLWPSSRISATTRSGFTTSISAHAALPLSASWIASVRASLGTPPASLAPTSFAPTSFAKFAESRSNAITRWRFSTSGSTTRMVFHAPSLAALAPTGGAGILGTATLPVPGTPTDGGTGRVGDTRGLLHGYRRDAAAHDVGLGESVDDARHREGPRPRAASDVFDRVAPVDQLEHVELVAREDLASHAADSCIVAHVDVVELRHLRAHQRVLVESPQTVEQRLGDRELDLV